MTKNELFNMFDGKIPIEYLMNIIFEMNRFFDKSFTKEIQDYQKANDIVFNQNERNVLRKLFYYGKLNCFSNLIVDDFPTISPSLEDEKKVLDSFFKRVQKYEEGKILGSVIERYNELLADAPKDNSDEWLEYYRKKNEIYKYSGIILEIDQNDFRKNGNDEKYIYKLISQTYDSLENYRYLIVHIKENIHDNNGADVTWKLIYKTILYAENFIQYKDDYFPCKKEKQIAKVYSFCQKHFTDDKLKENVSDFYKYISTGYKYEDCLINETSSEYILTFKKIKLDQSPIPCPECLTTIQSGNSYPEMFLRSYECKNPDCSARSKSGRGKRFDDYGQYRYFKLVKNNPKDNITSEMYSSWRRDIFNSKNNVYDMLAMYYFWAGEKIGIYNFSSSSKKSICGREIVKIPLLRDEYVNYEELPVVKFFSYLRTLVKNDKNKTAIIERNIALYNDDSTKFINSLKVGQIGAAITSPPYYNAREYSQWENLITYLIDVMRNTKAIQETMVDNAYYLYNIGDVVGCDNVYVASNMSNRRIPLGAYSSMVFELVGFNLVGNIIWDKGQVQSKRNSTINLFSGYVKFINCYEHVLVFKKGLSAKKTISKVVRFSPVIKINCKGENVYKHTAPYPPEMVELIKPFMVEDLWTLDPYLGSGTTLKWCKENNKKGLGIEMNEEYYNLCQERVFGDN